MATLPNSSVSGPLAPKYNLNQDTRDPHNKPEKPPGNWSGYIPFFVFFVFALVAIPLTLRQVATQKDIRQRASGPFPTQIIPSPTPFPSPTPTEAPSATTSPTLSPTIVLKKAVTATPTP